MAREPARAKQFVVREFQPADLASVVQISGGSVEASQWSPESYSAVSANASSLLLVADSGSGVSGFLAARWAGGEAEILNLAIDFRARRVGMGSALLAIALERFQQEHLDCVYLEVRASNAAAIGLYQKLGFAVASRRRAYYRDPVEDAVCMMKKLTGGAN